MVTQLVESSIVGVVVILICVGAVIGRETLHIHGTRSGRAVQVLDAAAWASTGLLILLVLARLAVISS